MVTETELNSMDFSKERIPAIIRSITLTNFKTFKGTTTIPLTRNLTVILGENASGKSNILEGLQFVFGESRTKQNLRAKNLKDLVYKSENQEVARCEVKIEVEVANEIWVFIRRLVRGVSQWFVNDKKVKKAEYMEQILQLNYDCSKYNFIPQGVITNKTVSDMNWRKLHFETATGTLSINEEIEQTKEVFESAEIEWQNANSLNEQRKVTFELIKEQSEDARKKIDLEHEIELMESQYKFNKLDRLEKQLITLKKNIYEIQETKKQLSEDHVVVEEKWRKKREEVENQKQELDQCHGRLKTLQEKRKALEEVVGQAGKELSELKNSEKIFTTEISELKEEINDIQKQRSELKAQLEQNKQILDNLTQKIIEEESDKKQLENTLSELLELRSHTEKELSIQLEECKGQLGLSEKDKQQFSEEVSRLEQELSRKANKKTQLKNSLKNLQTSLTEKPQEQLVLENQIRQLQNRYTALDQQVQISRFKVDQLQTKIDRISKRIEEIKEGRNVTTLPILSPIQKALETFGGNKSNNQSPTIIGLTWELLEWDGELDRAVIEAIGIKQLTMPVTETLEDSAKIMDWLSNNKLGRITLAPLNSLKWRDRLTPAYKQKILSIPGVCGFLSEYVTSRHSHLNSLKDNVCKNILLVENREVFSRLNDFNIVAVTKSGELSSSEGYLTGGVRPKDIYVYRKTPAEILRELSSEKEEHILIHKKEYTTYSEILEKRNKINSEILVNERKLGNLEKEIKEAEEACSKNVDALDNLEKDIEKCEHLQSEKLREMKEVDEKIKNQREKIRELGIKLDELNTSSEIHEVSEKIRNLTEEIKSLRPQEKKSIAIDAELKDQDTELRVKESRKDSIRIERTKQLKEKQNQITDITNQNQVKFTEFDQTINEETELEQKITEKTQQLQTDKMTHEEFDVQRQDLEKEIELTESEHKKITNQKNSLDLERERLLIAVEKYQNLNLTDSEVSARLREINRKLDELKDVDESILATYYSLEREVKRFEQQLQELSTRREELKSNLNDLVKLRKEKINTNFQSFQERFIILTEKVFNTSDFSVLLNWKESDFEIIIKSPQFDDATLPSSGGQTTLLAACFIIALQQMYPSNLYVFDEPSAHLTDGNTEILMKLIKSLSKDTQCIIITPDDYLVIAEADLQVMVRRDSLSHPSEILVTNLQEL